METNAAARIRKYEERDLDAVREICRETAKAGLREGTGGRFCLLLYCDPYLKLSPEDCFVAVDDADRPVGYLLCAADTRGFFRAFKKAFLPEIRSLGRFFALTARAVALQQTLCAVFAPAHLHIDLTQGARRQGAGTALVGALKAHLASKGIERVGLTCAKDNAPALRFYKKNGFRTVFGGFGARVLVSKTGEKNGSQ